MSRKSLQKNGGAASAAAPKDAASNRGSISSTLPPHAETEETPEFLTNSVHQLEQAVQLLPEQDTAAYRTALAQCPQLIFREAHPVPFLRCCAWNPWQAAARWMEYWKLRLEVFGPERCYRPLDDFSGNGALPEASIRIVETGCSYLNQRDARGRPVIHVDRSKFSPRLQRKWNCTVEEKLKAAFYVMHTLAQQQPEASRQGAVIFMLVTLKDPKVYPAVNRFVTRAFRECFPVQVQEIHVVFAPILEKPKRFAFAKKVVPFIRQMVQRTLYFANLNVHMVLAEKEAYQTSLARTLVEEIGIVPEALPPVAGGKWSFARYKRWYNAQQHQKQAAAALTSLPSLPSSVVRATSVATTTGSVLPTLVLPPKEDDMTTTSQLSLLDLLARAAENESSEEGDPRKRSRNEDDAFEGCGEAPAMRLAKTPRG